MARRRKTAPASARESELAHWRGLLAADPLLHEVAELLRADGAPGCARVGSAWGSLPTCLVEAPCSTDSASSPWPVCFR